MKYKNYKEVSTTIRRISDKVLTQDDLAKKIIIQKGNTYRAFDRYTIEETSNGWTVSSDTEDNQLIFNTAKVALTWCILSAAGRYAIAHHVEWLDARVTAKQFDIDVLSNVIENAEPLVNAAILLARLTEDINSRQVYKKQLALCVRTAKYIKLIGTNDELKRINKTSGRKHSR